ncbi:acyl-CoA thioesterase [Dermatobacter hominis]|uniref:acyl-CoA thioesterase n=1 Tax=Dermatobacter hominis TaxID=2884263 RepID=UPI001D0FBC27|nr:acyl-CoA thioesterase domain-containing protein [Dermatobacter hominis]UDY36979.1 thioesterase family protein [Dermatobacter hominis]
MDAAEFLGLEPTHNPGRWLLPVTDGIITGGNFLFGGCGLGAAVAAMEAVCERPLVWATAQYLSFATTGEIMDLDVTVAVSGRNTAQARAVGHVGDREILTVNAALGERDLPVEGQWAVMPEVAPPEECRVRAPRFGLERSIMTRLDVRIAVGRGWEDLDGHPVPDGRSALWVRVPDVEMSAAALSILGDYVPFGISQALGAWFPINSLDNTLRVVRLEPSEWVLIDIRVDGLHNGFGHGSVHLWNQAGTLLATASQSTLVRNHRLD